MWTRDKVHVQSLAVHAMQTCKHFEIVRQLMRDACNESCIRTPLKFEVDGLKQGPLPAQP